MNRRLVAAEQHHRLCVSKVPTGILIIEETKVEADEYVKNYFVSTYYSGLYDIAEAAKVDGRKTLPWLRADGEPQT